MRHVDPSWSLSLGSKLSAHVLMTDRSHGDFSLDQPRHFLNERQRGLVDASWAYLEQVHGRSVIQINQAGDHKGRRGDALCTNVAEAPLAIQVADCAPVALISMDGTLGMAHAGWKGIVKGVLDSTCSEIRRLGDQPSIAVVGACIQPTHYEFGYSDLKSIEKIFGPSIRSKTLEGRLALDLPELVRVALERNGIHKIIFLGGCTGSSSQYWSHRTNLDKERQVMVAWIGRES